VLRYWLTHSTTTLSSDQFAALGVPEGRRRVLEEMREDPDAFDHALLLPDLADDDEPNVTAAAADHRLATLFEQYRRSETETAMSRLSFRPIRGWVQPGLVTGAFLHFGFSHLFWNLFIFLIVGPLLEDSWGRRRFTAFYLFAAVISVSAEYIDSPRSSAYVAGASGAVAACMGAFARWHATERIRFRVVWFVWFRRFDPTVLVPAWVCGLLWFANQALALKSRTESGVAVLAHVGGFLFGLAFATWLGAGDGEAIVEAEAAGRAFVPPPTVDEADARAAMARDDDAAALRAWSRVLDKRPDHLFGALAAARLDLRASRPERAARRLAPILVPRLTPSSAREVVTTLGAELGAIPLTPAQALVLADTVARATTLPRETSEALLTRAGEAGGVDGARALAAAAESRIQARVAGPEASELLRRALAIEGLDDALHARISALLPAARRLAPDAARSKPPPPPPNTDDTDRSPLPKAASGRPSSARIVSSDATGFVMETDDGARVPLPFIDLTSISVGLAVPSRIPVVRFACGAAGPVFSVAGPGLGLQQRFPRLLPSAAFVPFLTEIVAASGARLSPDLESIRAGRLPEVADA